jgi:hypothetical protein
VGKSKISTCAIPARAAGSAPLCLRISAEAIVTQPDGTVVTTPLVAQVERLGRVGGFCGNIAQYAGIVTREAGIDLIRQARLAAGE